MSDWPRVITDDDGDFVEVLAVPRGVYAGTTENGTNAGVVLTVDQCAALIAAITDAAKVVTGEKA